MRPTWSGMISFGLVNIPIKLYSSSREKRTTFNYLHKEDAGRVQYQKVCKACGNTLESDEIVKGYQYRKGQYVTVTDEDFDKVDIPSTKALSIDRFVDPQSIDPVYFDEPFYVVPDDKSAGPYVLFREALKNSGKVGIGKITFRSREQLAAVRADGDMLMLETMHFADEVIPKEELDIPRQGAAVGDKEIELARVLIEHMAGEFKPEEYEDRYESSLRELIETKIAGQEVETTPSPMPQPTNVIDIIERLKQSIGEVEDKEKPKKRRKAS